ncbi:MAG: rhodanese-like domain-containing protein, partial [Pseudomonadota bacterium]
GALRLDPDADADAFMAQYGALIAGRDVIFYCSVGVRSSRMAERLAPVLGDARSVANLEGGVFAWHNQSRPLEDAQGATPFVHPYNRSWGRLVDRRDFIRRTPE